MNPINGKTRNGARKFSAAMLASAIALGGTGGIAAIPSASAEESVSASSANVQDAAREKLINLVYASVQTIQDFKVDSDDELLWKLNEAKNKAVKTIGDPNAGSSALKSADSKLDKALQAYINSKVRNTDDTDFFLYKILKGMLRGQDKEDVVLEPWEEVLYTTIIETRELMKTGPGSEEKRGEAGYKYYALADYKNNNLKAFNVDDYRARLSQYQANLPSELAVLEAFGVDYGEHKQDFDRSAAYLEQLLNGSYSKTTYDVALDDVASYVDLIEQGAGLVTWIQRANLLLDSPRGSQPGQYPATAFGKLNREINTAKRTLVKAQSGDEINETTYRLSVQISDFKASVNP